MLPGVGSPQAHKLSTDIKVDPRNSVETYIFVLPITNLYPFLDDHILKTVALLVCSMDDRRSRMVLPWMGSPKTQNKSNDIKVDPGYLVETRIPFLALLAHVYQFLFQDSAANFLAGYNQIERQCQIACQKQCHAKCQKNVR